MRRPVYFIFAILLSLIAHSAGARACEGALPDAQTNNVWYCWKDSDTAIVFVHGLHSSSRNAWLDEAHPDTYWPKLAGNDPALKGPAVFLAGFFTGTNSTTFGMREASSSLYTNLTSSIGGKPAVITRKNILFIAHSLGGILTRDMLSRYREQFVGKRIGLLLVASPSSGSNIANWMKPANAINMSQMVGELAVGSRYLQQLDDDFKALIKDRRLALEGRELFEQYWVQIDPTGLTSWLPSAVKHRMMPLVPMDSTAKYFPDPQLIPNSDHITIAKPDRPEHLTHQKLVAVYNLMMAAPAPSCSAPPDFEIALQVTTPDPKRGLNPKWSEAARALLPQYKFVRHLPIGDLAEPRAVPRDSATGSYFYKPRGEFPCRGEAFSATFSRVPPESRIAVDKTDTRLCFLRSAARPDEKSADLNCAEGRACSIKATGATLAEPCPTQGWTMPHFIGTAHAAADQVAAHWEVPSLTTLTELPEEIRTGFAQFTVKAPAQSALAAATEMSAGLTVNGVTLFVDGLAPHTERIAFKAAEPFNYTFALENLGFTGGTQGFETIALELKFWNGATLVRTDKLVRDDYVSYRHAPEVTIKDAASGTAYTWAGVYKPAKFQEAFEIMLSTNERKEGSFKDKAEFDARQRSYGGEPVIGVIRPGRKENKTYGMTFGLKLPTGQVKSLFTQAEAKDICAWVLSDKGVPEWMRKSAYLFRFPADSFNDTKDRGQYSGTCRKS